MTILQPLLSRVVVTVRPFSSVMEETARAVPVDPDEEEDDALTDDLADPEEDPTLTEWAPAEDVPRDVDTSAVDVAFTWRPSARIRNTSQPLFETLICSLCPGTATAAKAMKAKAALADRDMMILLLEGAARPPRGRASSHVA
jgi:hypothetical protein